MSNNKNRSTKNTLLGLIGFLFSMVSGLLIALLFYIILDLSKYWVIGMCQMTFPEVCSKQFSTGGYLITVILGFVSALLAGFLYKEKGWLVALTTSSIITILFVLEGLNFLSSDPSHFDTIYTITYLTLSGWAIGGTIAALFFTLFVCSNRSKLSSRF